MSRLVLDSSLALSWVLPGELTDRARAVRESIEAGDWTTVPSHWPLEIANALCMAARRKRISQADTAAALAAFQRLAIHIDGLTTQKAGGETIALAREHTLSVYDAAYLELAMRQAGAVASLDEPLRAAAKKLKVPVLPETL